MWNYKLSKFHIWIFHVHVLITREFQDFSANN